MILKRALRPRLRAARLTSARPIPLPRCSKPSGGWSHELQEMKTARSFILLACAAAVAGAEPVAEKAATPPAMAWIPGGTFLMGTNDKESFPNERPAHRVQVQGFWMDEHDVTNAEFSKFVEATGYVTTAERKINWEDLNSSALSKVVPFFAAPTTAKAIARVRVAGHRLTTGLGTAIH